MTNPTAIVSRRSPRPPDVRLVALKPLPYEKIRQPGDVFTAAGGYAKMFVARGLAREATEDDVQATTSPESKQDKVPAKPNARPRNRRQYHRRDKQAEK